MSLICLPNCQWVQNRYFRILKNILKNNLDQSNNIQHQMINFAGIYDLIYTCRFRTTSILHWVSFIIKMCIIESLSRRALQACINICRSNQFSSLAWWAVSTLVDVDIKCICLGVLTGSRFPVFCREGPHRANSSLTVLSADLSWIPCIVSWEHGLKKMVLYILLKKSFAPLTLISLYFNLPIPVKSRKMIGSSPNFQRMFSVLNIVVPVKHAYFYGMKLFLFKNHIFDPKMQNHHIYVFW